jgi:hypothetical protein
MLTKTINKLIVILLVIITMGAIQITKISHYMKRFFIKRHLVKLLKRKFRNTHQVYYDDNGFLTFKPKPNVTKSSIASRIN